MCTWAKAMESEFETLHRVRTVKLSDIRKIRTSSSRRNPNDTKDDIILHTNRLGSLGTYLLETSEVSLGISSENVLAIFNGDVSPGILLQSTQPVFKSGYRNNWKIVGLRVNILSIE